MRPTAPNFEHLDQADQPVNNIVSLQLQPPDNSNDGLGGQVDQVTAQQVRRNNKAKDKALLFKPFLEQPTKIRHNSKDK